MRKRIIGTIIAAGIITNLHAQPVSASSPIPVEITLNEILRINVIEGGNIEFVFNTINQYRTGISNGKTAAGVDQFYNTHFTIVASATWELDFGAEFSVMRGTDNFANTMALDNIGFTVGEIGTNTCCLPANAITAASNAVLSGVAGGAVNGLAMFGTTYNPLMTSGVAGNFGTSAANDFYIHWECGTLIAGGTGTPMNTATLLNQNLAPDRYVTNVFLDVNSF